MRVCGCAAHSLCVGIVGSEVQGHGADDPQLRGHLLHPPEASLLLRVGELHNQARRGSLRWETVQYRNIPPSNVAQFIM